MQIIAMITMLVDHIGIVFFPDNALWRIVGRIALPIYAYGIVQGFFHTRSRPRYLRRLTVLALLSQIPYMASLNTTDINTIGTLAVCLTVLLIAERFEKWTAVACSLAGMLLLEALPFSYGSYALLLILLYRYLDAKYWVPAHLALNLLSLAYNTGWQLQLFSSVPTIFFAYGRFLLPDLRFKLVPPGWIWRSFYPVHLTVLAVLAAWINR